MAANTGGPRIRQDYRPTHAVVVLTAELSDLLDAARTLSTRARECTLRSTAEQCDRIAAQLDVLRTIIVAEGDQHAEVAAAYVATAADRLAVHGGYIGKAAARARA